MAILISIIVLTLAVMVQTSIIANIPLLHGIPDLIMLIILGWSVQRNARHFLIWTMIGGLLMGYVSETPLIIYVLTYLFVAVTGRLITYRLWESSLLTMFLLTIAGTVLLAIASYIIYFTQGVLLPVLDSINQIALPSLILNIILAVPIYYLMKDLAGLLNPVEVET